MVLALPRLARSRALVLALVLGACGGDDDGDGTDGDGPPADAALGADASEVLPDAGATTACGPGEEIMYCDRSTEICVQQETGPGYIYECAELPDGCDPARDCAGCSQLCNMPDDCVDSDADNTILCACPECA
ncbi:MAG TPA: hypothetical protein VFU21_02190 [Kofleriaceae bacterium]|nr:hypothetical protein [Kofleriaceae bacterium]